MSEDRATAVMGRCIRKAVELARERGGGRLDVREAFDFVAHEPFKTYDELCTAHAAEIERRAQEGSGPQPR